MVLHACLPKLWGSRREGRRDDGASLAAGQPGTSEI